MFQGHGTHVSATIVGSHINGLGHGKEGIAPAARAHFFDICADNRCLSPHRHWFDSFTSGTSESPKVASASWGTAYLVSDVKLLSSLPSFMQLTIVSVDSPRMTGLGKLALRASHFYIP